MNHSDEDQWARALWDWIGTILGWLRLCLLGVFILSQWLTKLLLRHVFNPLLGGWLDRHDGGVVLISTSLWSVLAGGLLFPLAMAQGWLQVAPADISSAWLISLGAGALWGSALGAWVLLDWWSELEAAHPPTQDFTQVLNLPPDFYRTS